MSFIIICNSKTGFTKRYADWIAEALHCEVLPYARLKEKTIDKSDIVLFGSRLHAGRIEYLNKIKAQFAGHKNLIVFVTGATSASETETIEKVWMDNFTEQERQSIPHFYMQSGLNYEEMGFVDRMMMQVMIMVVGAKKKKNDREKEVAQAISSSHDHSSKESIAPLLAFIRENYSEAVF